MEEEQQRTNYRHRIPAQLRFSDVDRFGHVNNAVIFSLYDMAKTEYFGSVLRDLVNGDTHTVVANINANFIYPVFYGDKIEILTAVTKIGTKSITVSQEAVNTRTGSTVSTCRTVMVCFSASKNDSVPVPNEARQRIIAYEDNILL
jgi:acyl-CoA thioester hydrolase